MSIPFLVPALLLQVVHQPPALPVRRVPLEEIGGTQSWPSACSSSIPAIQLTMVNTPLPSFSRAFRTIQGSVPAGIAFIVVYNH